MRASRFPRLLRLSLAGLALAVASSCAQPCPVPDEKPVSKPAAAASELVIAVVGTSDLHGYIEGRPLAVPGPDGAKQEVSRGGLPLFSGYLDNLRAKQPVLLLDGGDLFQGTLVSNLQEGLAVIDGYNALGYSAAAVGNHEFDYGPVGPRAVPRAGSDDDPTGALKARIAGAHFPFLSANLLDRTTKKTPAWPNLYPSKLITVAGVPIGVIGATTESTPRTTNPMNLRDVEFAPVVPSVLAQAKALREQGAAAVVLTIHEGANCQSFTSPRDLSSCLNNDERIISIARELGSNVDAIVAGHSHAGVAHFVGETPVIQAFAYGVAFGRIDLRFTKTAAGTYSLDKTRTVIHPPIELCSVTLPTDAELQAAPPATAAAPGPGGKAPAPPRPPLSRCDEKVLAGRTLQPAVYEERPIVPNPALLAALKPHIDRVTAQRAMSINLTLEQKLKRNFRNESPLGQLLAELVRSGAARVSGQPVLAGFQNGGGIRNELPAGPLTYGHVYEVLPFDNRLALIRLTGAQLTEVFLKNLAGSHGVLIPGGLTVEARCNGPTLSVDIRDDKGQPLKPDQTYVLALSDFLAAGGDSFGSVVAKLPENAVTYFDDVMLRELVLEELQRYRGPLLSGSGKPRLVLPMPRPVRCDGKAELPPGE